MIILFLYLVSMQRISSTREGKTEKEVYSYDAVSVQGNTGQELTEKKNTWSKK